jgi:hypothetical protein
MGKRKDPDAARLGRKGGKSRSEAKVKAARENLIKARETRSAAKAKAARENLAKARKKRWQHDADKEEKKA